MTEARHTIDDDFTYYYNFEYYDSDFGWSTQTIAVHDAEAWPIAHIEAIAATFCTMWTGQDTSKNCRRIPAEASEDGIVRIEMVF